MSKRDYPIKRTPKSHADMVKYGRGTKWGPSQRSGEKYYDLYTEKYGPFTIYISGDDSVKVACINDECYDQNDRRISKEEAAEMLGVETLHNISDYGINNVEDELDFLQNLKKENKTNNKKQIKETMGNKKVLRYTEEEFISLLENIVKRVKKEQRLEESRKESRKARINENLERIRRNRRKDSRRR